MFKKVVLVIVVVVGGIFGYIGMQSPDYEIARETLIFATPDLIFPYINNSKLMNEWMPWKDSDPQVSMSYSGPDEGIGSVSSWESSGQMGVGSAEIIESIPNEKVTTKLVYVKPMEMAQTAYMVLAPDVSGTKIRWSVKGKNDFFGRLFCLFMNMDKNVGAEFEKGLQNLKLKVESSAKGL